MSEEKKTYGVARQGMKNAVVYMRADDPCDAEHSLTTQKKVLQSFAVNNGYIIRKFYSDIGSDLDLERNGLTDMKKHIAEGGIEAILTVSLGSEIRDFFNSIDQARIDFVSVNEGSLHEIPTPSDVFNAIRETFIYGDFENENMEDEI
ncbi:MAG: recombinase family protein [Oscillospiraceae bacterium]|nr:recombinase family protein [Oscillospiraceae bacterium]